MPLKPYYGPHAGITIYHGDVLVALRDMDAESVNCVVTSPPYWGLRDYGTGKWEGGDPDCQHRVGGQVQDNKAPGAITRGQRPGADARFCKDCGAVRIDNQIGLEQTPQEYVAKIVEVFREVRRVLRKDGTCWVNLGDSYCSTAPGTMGDKLNQRGILSGVSDRRSEASRKPRPETPTGLKPKDLVGIPWRVAFALQDDGWYLRQDIIWSKPNPMPESVTDRCTKSHEYLFLLSKGARYYFNQDAILEPCSPGTHARLSQNVQDQIGSDRVPGKTNGNMKAVGRHLPGNHSHKGTTAYENGDERQRTKAGLVDYAVKMRKLAEAGSGTKNNSSFDAAMAIMPEKRNKRSVWEIATQPYSEAHFATYPEKLVEPCILAGCPSGGVVLDPFGGSMTTLLVAQRLNCKGIAIELNAEYIEIGTKRFCQDVFEFAETSA